MSAASVINLFQLRRNSGQIAFGWHRACQDVARSTVAVKVPSVWRACISITCKKKTYDKDSRSVLYCKRVWQLTSLNYSSSGLEAFHFLLSGQLWVLQFPVHIFCWVPASCTASGNPVGTGRNEAWPTGLHFQTTKREGQRYWKIETDRGSRWRFLTRAWFQFFISY